MGVDSSYEHCASEFSECAGRSVLSVRLYSDSYTGELRGLLGNNCRLRRRDGDDCKRKVGHNNCEYSLVLTLVVENAMARETNGTRSKSNCLQQVAHQRFPFLWRCAASPLISRSALGCRGPVGKWINSSLAKRNAFIS